MELVKDVMTTKVITSLENDSLVDIGKKMAKYEISCIIIVRDRKPVGLITERDLSQRVVAKNLNCKKTKAKQVMTKSVKYIEPDKNIYYANQQMKKKKIRRFPVVQNGELVGVITQSDLIRYFSEQRKRFVLSNLKKEIKESYPI
ncbi:MAG: CBS domain-containing protein [archaeon]